MYFSNYVCIISVCIHRISALINGNILCDQYHVCVLNYELNVLRHMFSRVIGDAMIHIAKILALALSQNSVYVSVASKQMPVTTFTSIANLAFHKYIGNTRAIYMAQINSGGSLKQNHSLLVFGKFNNMCIVRFEK